MCESLLIKFDTSLWPASAQNKDLSEVFSDVLLHPLRMIAGKEVLILPYCSISYRVKQQASIIEKLFWGVVAAISSPIALLGIGFCLLSSTHSVSYQQFVKRAESRSKITDLSSKPLLDRRRNIAPADRRKKWESSSASSSMDEMRSTLRKQSATWRANQEEHVERGELNTERREAIRELNARIFSYMKREGKVETPMDFLWSLNGITMIHPIPLGNGKEMRLQEGISYRLDPWRAVPVEMIRKELRSTVSFGLFLRLQEGQLCLYLDGVSEHQGIYINGQLYLANQGKGKGVPSYVFTEGDLVCYAGVSSASYLFKVGSRGTIHYHDDKLEDVPRSEEAKQQSLNFERMIERERMFEEDRTSTSLIKSSEIDKDMRLLPGFYFHSEASVEGRRMSDQVEDVIVVDPGCDETLRKVADYFKEEFRVFQFTQEEQMARLYSFAFDVFSRKSQSYIKNQNYLLGEVMRSGGGVCRHRALLIKYLADELHIPCALISAIVKKPVPIYSNGKIICFNYVPMGHAWNIVTIEGRNWVVDAMYEQVFPVDAPPGASLEQQEKVCRFYGLSHPTTVTG